MSLSNTSKILNKLGNPVTNQQFYDLLKQFCREEKDVIETLVETKKFLDYFGSYLQAPEFQIQVFKIIQLSYEICKNSNDIPDILLKTSITNLMETYVTNSALSGVVKESVLDILEETFSSGKLPPQAQIINLCIMLSPIFKDKDNIQDKLRTEDEIIEFTEAIRKKNEERKRKEEEKRKRELEEAKLKKKEEEEQKRKKERRRIELEKEEQRKKLKKEEERRIRELKEEKVRKNVIVKKIKKMMSVSTRIRLDMMRETIEMDFKEFNKNIWDWAKEFNFIIDGDYIVVENADIDGFINILDGQFELWSKSKKK